MRPPTEWLRTAAVIAFCCALPVVILAYVLTWVVVREDVTDFEYAFYPAAQAFLAGETLYPAIADPVLLNEITYTYPPLTAIFLAPLTVLSVHAAEVAFAVLLAAVVVITLRVLGVRDWRCYGIAFLWPPVISAVQSRNVTILLGLGAALAWRYRDRPLAAGASVGVTAATKLLLWPLGIWLAAVGRVRAAVWSMVLFAAVFSASWAAVGFDGFLDYPSFLRELGEIMGERGYSVHALALDLDASEGVARLLGAIVGLALLAGVLLLARQGDERGSFVLAIAASIALSPIVWLHYFALLLVGVAVVQPRLGYLWFLPLPMYFAAGQGHGTTFQTALTLGVAALTVTLAVLSSWSASRWVGISATARRTAEAR